MTNISLETLPDTLSLSLTGIRLSPKQARLVNNGYVITSRTMDDYRYSPRIKFVADLFPAHRELKATERLLESRATAECNA